MLPQPPIPADAMLSAGSGREIPPPLPQREALSLEEIAVSILSPALYLGWAIMLLTMLYISLRLLQQIWLCLAGKG